MDSVLRRLVGEEIVEVAVGVVAIAVLAFLRLFDRRSLARQHRAEEAVGAVLQGRQAAVRSGRELRRQVELGDRRHGEVGMALDERLDLPLVLGRQHRAGGIDQPPARLHQPGGLVEDVALLRHQLGEVLGLERPAAVGIAPPRARPGARRVDQHAVEVALLALQPLGVVDDRAALDIVHAGAAQALGRAVEPRGQHVHRHHAALVVHAGGDGERLAAGTGAVVGDLHAVPGAAQRRHELRALVLDLDQPVLERLAGDHRQPALQAQPVGGKAHRLGVDALAVQRPPGLLGRRLDAVDAQVNRRRRLERGDLAAPRLAIGLAQVRCHPFLDVEPHPVGLLGMGQRMALHLAQRPALGVVQGRRPVASAVEHRLELGELQAIQQHQLGRDDGARRAVGMAGAVEPPPELAPAAQDAPDPLGHGAAVAAADVAAGAEERICDAIGRPVRTADDLVQEFHGGGNPCARSHRIPFDPAATMNSPAAQRLPPASRLREGLKRLALVVASVLFSLVLLELGLRVFNGAPGGWQGLTHWPNLVLQARTASWDRHTVPDPRLGFIPRPDFYWEHGMAHYDAYSDRLTPAPPGVTLAEPPVLVVGDSFAHGDETSDEETWPTLLQPLLHRRVINAAMSGYGIDQMVLRGEIVAARVKPSAIVLSFISDDVRRMEMKRVWGAEKPYFALIDGKLVERNVPVPPSPDPATTLDGWDIAFGRSVLVKTVLTALGWWYEWTADHVRAMPSGDGLALVCP